MCYLVPNTVYSYILFVNKLFVVNIIFNGPKLICLHIVHCYPTLIILLNIKLNGFKYYNSKYNFCTIELFQVLLSNTNSLIYSQLNGFIYRK